MKTPFAAATFAIALTLSPLAARAQGAAAPDSCSPTVSAALETWDLGMAAAERFGEKAVALAREKGREYLLPLLGIDPKTPPSSAHPDAERTTDDVARAVEASRNDPKRRAELCVAVTRAMNEARDTAANTAGAGLDALRRAVEGLRSTLPAAPAAPAPAPDGAIRT
ncbi:hypothetical protein [Azospirillum agricola]|uniref:hypothetical protein n=1 Tax=Azospirillum agricola TaxID=1720247 RepID=UPI000A0EF298|nr:hypothetical protein [Azospirillum agricola]SMH33424.1 hypothetical protein SAMN02982994_0654 [Azospirillum lipoferum]